MMKEKKLATALSSTTSASLTISTHNLPRSSFEMAHGLPRSTKNRKTAGSTKFMMMMPPSIATTNRRTSIRQPAASNSTSLMSLKSSTSNTAAAAVKRSGSRAVGTLPIVKQRTI